MTDPTAALDYRKLPRKRGAALTSAIYQATLDELREAGYPNLTMERIAERAGTGKAALYRRWPSRMELVLDAVDNALLPAPDAQPDTGSLRGDLLAALRGHADVLAGPAGEAMRGVLFDALRDPARTEELRRRSMGREQRTLGAAVRRAVARGEIDTDRVTPARLEAGRAMLRQYFLFNGPPVPDEVITTIVDEVVLPLLDPSYAGPTEPRQ